MSSIATAVVGYTLLALLFLFLAALLVFYCNQSTFFYQARRARRTRVAPQDGTVLHQEGETKVTFNNIEANTVDGLVLRGYRVTYEGPLNETTGRKRLIQYNHGTRVYLPNKVDFFRRLSLQLRDDIIAFAYRGFTESDGNQHTEEGCMRDIDAISNYFAEQVKAIDDDVDVILYGKSYGCATSIVAALTYPQVYDVVILESPFTSVKAVFRNLIRCFGPILACISTIGWRNDQRIGDIKVPILFISGTADPLTPNFMTHELCRRAISSPLKHVHDIAGGTHNALYKTDTNYYSNVESFLGRVFRRQKDSTYQQLTLN